MSATIFRTASVLLACMICVQTFAATRMVFPRVLFQKGRFVGIAVANPTKAEATVTFTAHNFDGSLFGGPDVLNPVTSKIAAGSQIVQLGWQIFLKSTSPYLQSSIPTRVWVEVASSTDGLTGFFLEGNDSLTFIDGADLTGAGTNLFLPVIDNVGTSSTEIAVVNPTTTTANLLVDLIRADGSAAASNLPFVLPRLGGLQGPIGSFFKASYDGVIAARIRSDVPVTCVASIYRQADNSLVTLAAQDATTPSKVLYFPQLAQGAGWATSVGVVNTDPSQNILVTLTAYRDDGGLFAPPAVRENPKSVQIEAGGVLAADARSLFGFADAPASLQTGWLKVEGPQSSLLGYVEYTAGGRDRAVVPALTNPVTSALFSYQVLVAPYFTGAAVLNPGSLAASFEVVSFDRNGSPYGKAQRVLKPGQKEARVISQWIPTAEGRSEGGILVRADRPLIVTQLFGTDSAVANVPPQPVTSDFNPGQGIARVITIPPLAVVETGKTQQFTSPGFADARWAVEDVVGGNDAVGTINSVGLYRAPTKTPARKNVTVQAIAATGDRSGASTVDVVQRETLAGGLTILTSVSYVENLARFFVAEQQLVAAPAGMRAAGTSHARISEVLPGGTSQQFIAPIQNETIAKMVPFTNGTSTYLLMAGLDSGKIYRLDIASKQLATVRTGLSKPNSLAVDPVSGNLFVTESGASQITTIARSEILAATGADVGFAAPGGPVSRTALTLAGVPRGIAVDACSAQTFYTLADGTLHELKGGPGGDHVVNTTPLINPGQIVVLYRDGLPCGDGLALAVTESNRVSLIYPRTGTHITLIGDMLNPADITFLLRGNPFTKGEASLGIADNQQGTTPSQITSLPLGNVFSSVPPAVPARPTSASGGASCDDPLGDVFISSGSGFAVPDIQSVSATPFDGSMILSIKLKETVAPPPESGFNAFIFVYQKGFRGEYPAFDLALYDPLGLIDPLGIESHVNAALSQMWSLSRADPIQLNVSYSGNIVSIAIPLSALDLATAAVRVYVGVGESFTDVAPNSGLLKLGP